MQIIQDLITIKIKFGLIAEYFLPTPYSNFQREYNLNLLF